MTVIADIAVDPGAFVLGSLFEAHPDVTVRLERLVPLGERVVPLVWVDGYTPAVEAALRADPDVESARLLTRVEDRALFEVGWHEAVDALVGPLLVSGADVLGARGSADGWELRLQFDRRAELTGFVDCCRAADVGFRLRRLFNPESLDVDVTDDLTPEQYEILATAYERGFFEVPRGVTLGELADRLDISSNSASQRMRRALDLVVERQLATGRPAPGPTPGDREWTVGSESGS